MAVRCTRSWLFKKKRKAGGGEKKAGAAAIKEVKIAPEKMLILPLCEQLIGRLLHARRLQLLLLAASVAGFAVRNAVAFGRAGGNATENDRAN